MHIPDGMLDTTTWVATAAGSAGFVAYAVRQVRRRLSEGRLVLMSVLAALIFALQMLNFPVAGGTSGHFAGGAAAAILLGPWPAVVIMTTVLLIQAFVFADGGVTALGANVLNMAIIGPFVGWYVYALVSRLLRGRRGVLAGSFAAGWVAVFLAALAAALEIALSGRAPLALVAGSMAFWHALIGAGEGAITAGLVGYVLSVRPDLVTAEDAPADGRRGIPALATLAAVAASLSFLASRAPDGLAFVAGRLGVPEGRSIFAGPAAGYALPGVRDTTAAGILAGLVGALLAGIALYGGVSLLLRSRRAQRAGAAGTGDDGFHRHVHRHLDEPAHAHPHHHVGTGQDEGIEVAHDHTHDLKWERYTWILSPVHALDPRAKIAATLALVVAIVLSPPLPALALAAAAALLLAAAALARLPLGHVLARSALVLPFAGTIALLAPLARAGGSLNWAGIAGSYAHGGWVVAYAILSKAWLSVLTVVLLSATTPVPKLFRGLERLHVPDVILMMLAFMYRYVGAMRDQVSSLRRALDSRAPELTFSGRLRLYGHLAGNMFLRSYERGERVYAAMRSRGYDGTIPSAEALALKPGDGLLLLVTALAIAALALAGRHA
ncbi:MAG TPA: cobalt ECF transporter T component CbiQ [Coriobacteriia bacterium]